MKTEEHLLVCLAEECGEVAKECHKALRFGLDDQVTFNPLGERGSEGPTVREKIVAELNDIMAIVEMLISNGALPSDWINDEAQSKKISRVKDYMEYAKKGGTLEAV